MNDLDPGKPSLKEKWACPTCEFLNFGFRQECRECRCPRKVGEAEVVETPVPKTAVGNPAELKIEGKVVTLHVPTDEENELEAAIAKSLSMIAVLEKEGDAEDYIKLEREKIAKCRQKLGGLKPTTVQLQFATGQLRLQQKALTAAEERVAAAKAELQQAEQERQQVKQNEEDAQKEVNRLSQLLAKETPTVGGQEEAQGEQTLQQAQAQMQQQLLQLQQHLGAVMTEVAHFRQREAHLQEQLQLTTASASPEQRQQALLTLQQICAQQVATTQEAPSSQDSHMGVQGGETPRGRERSPRRNAPAPNTPAA